MRLGTFFTNIGFVLLGLWLFSNENSMAKLAGALLIVGTVIFLIERKGK